MFTSPQEINPIIIVVSLLLLAWTIFWKAVALWRSANLKQRNWFVLFIALLFLPLNDLGIVELIYLFKFSKKRLTIAEVKSWFKRN